MASDSARAHGAGDAPRPGPARETRRGLRGPARRYHRWLGWVVGVVLTAWVVSGVVMITPGGERKWSPPDHRPRVGDVTVSPAQAIAAAGAGPEATVQLKPFGNAMLYQVFDGGRSTLVHGGTASVLTVNAAVAESLAFGERDARGRTPVMLERHSAAYPVGPLPVWRFPLDDGHTFIDVVVRDGGVWKSGRSSRLREVVTGLHTFLPVRLLVGERLNRWVLIATSVLSLVSVITGYLLILPRRSRSAD